MPFLYFKEDKYYKFWFSMTDGNDIYTEYGKIGVFDDDVVSIRTQAKSCETVEEAQKILAKNVKQKITKGYQLPSPDAKPNNDIIWPEELNNSLIATRGFESSYNSKLELTYINDHFELSNATRSSKKLPNYSKLNQHISELLKKSKALPQLPLSDKESFELWSSELIGCSPQNCGFLIQDYRFARFLYEMAQRIIVIYGVIVCLKLFIDYIESICVFYADKPIAKHPEPERLDQYLYDHFYGSAYSYLGHNLHQSALCLLRQHIAELPAQEYAQALIITQKFRGRHFELEPIICFLFPTEKQWVSELITCRKDIATQPKYHYSSSSRRYLHFCQMKLEDMIWFYHSYGLNADVYDIAFWLKYYQVDIVKILNKKTHLNLCFEPKFLYFLPDSLAIDMLITKAEKADNTHRLLHFFKIYCSLYPNYMKNLLHNSYKGNIFELKVWLDKVLTL